MVHKTDQGFQVFTLRCHPLVAVFGSRTESDPISPFATHLVVVLLLQLLLLVGATLYKKA